MQRILLIILFLYIGLPVYSQQDTLSWSYVINQEWSRPAKLDSFVGIHPRLLLEDVRIEALKSKIVTTHKFIWDVVKGKADGYLTSDPKNNPNDESNTRSDGDAIPWLALAFLMTNDSQYSDKAIDWMTIVCNYSTWDGNHSLGAGHCLLGVAIGYDWLYNKMSTPQREIIQNRLTYFASEMAENPQHKERYLSNHCQVEYTGLAAAGFAMYDEVSEAENWIRHAYFIFNEAYEISGNDGGSTEGHQYYGLMTEFQMHFNKMAKEILGRNFYQESEWLKNLGYFILYSALPDFSGNEDVMRYGDTKVDNYNGHGPTYQLLNVASEYRNPYFQWLALEMYKRGIGTTHRMGWANLLWFDETIIPKSFDTLPTFRYCEDVGWITSRSDWSENAVMIGFKCGPFHGHAVQELYDDMTEYNGIVNGHGHPDVNHFNIYAFGKWLATDDGYSKPKWTSFHNTILVNGYGQLGEGSKYFDRSAVFYTKATSQIIKAESNIVYDYIIGDAENIYNPQAGLVKFLRHLIFFKPDVIIVIDELEANKASKFEWRLHTDGIVTKGEDQNYLITNNDVILDVNFLLPASITDNNQTNLLNIYSDQNADKTIILNVMHVRKSNYPPITANLLRADSTSIQLDIMTHDKRDTITIDLINQEITVPTNTGNIHGSRTKMDKPEHFRLLQNYPNPFNPDTFIEYSVNIPQHVKLNIYDINGKLVRTLENNNRQAGNYKVRWDGKDVQGQEVSSGLYLYQINTDRGHKDIKKALLLR